MAMSGLQIFKYLPAAKKAEHSNCKECGCPTCMAFALKLAKGGIEISKCPFAPNDLIEIFEHETKQPQKTIQIQDLKIGGENVLYRHEKTFVNKTAIAVILDTDKPDWEKKLKRIENFEIKRVNEIMKVDLIVFKGEKRVETTLNHIFFDEFINLGLKIIQDTKFSDVANELIEIRTKAIETREEKYSEPVVVHFSEGQDLSKICAKAAFYLCKYANLLLFEDIYESMFSTLMTLRQNIFTDPQKPLQVESKIYEFNNPDENSLIFMTTNFALTFFAVANELESLPVPSYLIVTPAEGMSVLTAWSAEKFTAQMVAKTLKKLDFASRVKNRKIIIPGLLAHMKEELEEAIDDFEIVVGTVDSYAISDFVKIYINENK